MKIQDLQIKNFGKFHQKSVHFSDGFNVIYGENESGKSTIHTFVRSMLFGLERGRGRAAQNDTFARFEPWEEPNFYAGGMRFSLDGKRFYVNRNFDRYQKQSTLICETDGEELSIPDGDMTMLLDGMTQASYEDTVSIGQLQEKPGNTLAGELNNYATNFYVTGDSNLNLEAAYSSLKNEKKETEKALKEVLHQQQIKREKVENESSYIWRDICEMNDELLELEEEIHYREVQEEQKVKPIEPKKFDFFDEIRTGKWRVHPLEIVMFILVLVAINMLLPHPWSYLVAIVFLLLSTIYTWNRMKVGKHVEKTESERILEEIAAEDEMIPLEKLYWQREHLQEELKERTVQHENLQEQLEEIEETPEIANELYRKGKAIELAIGRIHELTEGFQRQLQYELNQKASLILSEITEGKYQHLFVDGNLALSVLMDGKKVPVERLSQGTIEQIYFALRMAVGDVLFTEPHPVILDDSFVNYDDRRLEQVLSWLGRQKRQVLLFTCQKREIEALNRLDIAYQLTRLDSLS